MPKTKLTLGDKETIIARATSGESTTTLATEFSVSVQYVRQLVRLAQEPDQENAPRIKMNTCICEECWYKYEPGTALGFQRYEGESDKYLCSAECFEAYAKRIYPVGDNRGRTKEFQAAILRKSARFFPEVDFTDETDQKLKEIGLL